MSATIQSHTRRRDAEPGVKRAVTILLGPAVMLFGLALPAEGQDPAAAVHVGELYDSIQSQSNPAQSYALYLPSTYTPDRAWPLLVLMDPRGRGLVPLAAIQNAAERYGYVVMSSLNTVSDNDVWKNELAFDAMVTDAQGALALDPRRLYVVGLSGTARVAWDFGFRLGDNVAGVLGVGAGHEQSMILPVAIRDYGRPFAFFGTAGVLDFNYEELKALDARLDGLDFPHHVEYFDGGHQWPPDQVFERAVEWFELQAIPPRTP